MKPIHIFGCFKSPLSCLFYFFLFACMLGVTQKRDAVCYRKRTDGFFVSFLILLLEWLNNARRWNLGKKGEKNLNIQKKCLIRAAIGFPPPWPGDKISTYRKWMYTDCRMEQEEERRRTCNLWMGWEWWCLTEARTHNKDSWFLLAVNQKSARACLLLFAGRIF